MRAIHRASRFRAYVALPLFAAACAQAEPTDPPLAQGAETKASRIINEKTPGRAEVDTTFRFQDPAPLKLTLEELRTGPSVLLRNPKPVAQQVRLAVVDSSGDLPLSRLLATPAEPTRVRSGTGEWPGVANVALASATETSPAKPGLYYGYLVAESADTIGTPLARRRVLVTVPEPASITAVSPAWSTEVFKFAPFARLRSNASEHAEMRCAPDHRTRGSGILPGALRHLMGPCIRDNELPVAIVGSPAVLSGENRKSGTPERRMLGVLQQKDSVDRAVVWWTGTPIDSGGPGSAAGLELAFTSLDQPGEYRGTISLASVGGTGEVELRVRVTHDWPYVVLALLFGVALSTWLRSYVRTRRAVLELEETRARLVSTIEAADLAFNALDRPRDGKHPYQVDAALLGELHRIDHRIRRHARDRTQLEPGSAENEKLRGELDACDKQVTTWDGFLHALQALRGELDTAGEAADRLRPGSGDTPALFGPAERHFAGKPLATAEVPPVQQQVEASCRLVKSWGEVADGALSLRAAGATADSKVETLAAAGREVDAAVTALFAATDAEAVDGVAATLHEVEEGLGPVQPTLARRMVRTMLGRGAASTAAEGQARVAAAAREDERIRLIKREIASVGVRIPFQKGRKVVWAWGVVSSSDPGERERVARQGRQMSDLTYLFITTTVAVLTGFNELYLDAFGFGTMQDYLLAVLWGFGAKLGIDTVRVAVEGGRIPWPGRKDAPSVGQTQQPTTTEPTTTTQPQPPADPDAPATDAAGGEEEEFAVPPDHDMPQGEGDPETEGETEPVTAGERVKTPEELGAAG